MEFCCFVIIWFSNVLLKRKDFCLTSVTQRRRQKPRVYKTIKCNNNVNDSNKNVTNFFLIYSITSQPKQRRSIKQARNLILFCFEFFF